MTEAEWLACGDPIEMLNAIWHRVSERQLRLFACHTFRRWRTCDLRFQKVPAFSFAIDVAERMAEQDATAEEVEAARGQLDQWMHRWNGGEVSVRGWSLCVHAVSHPIRLEDAVEVLRGWRWLQQFGSAGADQLHDEASIQRVLLAELVGNPFHPPTFPPPRLTSTVVALASQMYGSGDFSAMPILADALQDAGCENEDILNHCRDPQGVHVRGCWVVDGVLNKS